jgi:hypothetical protein
MSNRANSGATASNESILRDIYEQQFYEDEIFNTGPASPILFLLSHRPPHKHHVYPQKSHHCQQQ